MVIVQGRSKRKNTGGRLRTYRKTKRKYELGRRPALTKIDEKSMKKIRTRGNSRKNRLLSHNVCNLLDPKTKKYSQAQIKQVIECPANTNYVRRNIMVKGAIILTDKGKARITSRPGQDGTINAVLV